MKSRSREIGSLDCRIALKFDRHIDQQQCCQGACQISERSDKSKYKSRGFETLRDLMIRCLIKYWNRVQFIYCNTIFNDQWLQIPHSFFLQEAGTHAANRPFDINTMMTLLTHELGMSYACLVKISNVLSLPLMHLKTFQRHDKKVTGEIDGKILGGVPIKSPRTWWSYRFGNSHYNLIMLRRSYDCPNFIM